VYDYIVKQLIHPSTPYRVCILRLADDAEHLRIAASDATAGTPLQERSDLPRAKGKGIVGRVFATGKGEIIWDIEQQPDDYENIAWIRSQGLKSHACLPLTIEGRTIGTLSLFTGYFYKFYDSDRVFLQKTTDLIAIFIERLRVVRELRRTSQERDNAKDRILSAARSTGYTQALQGVLHQYKNELLSFCNILQEISEAGVVRRTEQMIQRQIELYQDRITTIQKEFESDNPTPINVNDVIREVITHFETRERNITIEIDFEPDIPYIMLNQADLTDVIYSLLSNAMKAVQKANRKQGEVAVTTEISKSDGITYIQIGVEDNGVGIRKEQSSKIFEKGFTNYRNEGGTGQGLFIAREILSHYGGKIFFESTMGKGSKFWIKIPLKRYQV
jgi:signal transduction histidine kinase